MNRGIDKSARDLSPGINGAVIVENGRAVWQSVVTEHHANMPDRHLKG